MRYELIFVRSTRGVGCNISLCQTRRTYSFSSDIIEPYISELLSMENSKFGGLSYCCYYTGGHENENSWAFQWSSWSDSDTESNRMQNILNMNYKCISDCFFLSVINFKYLHVLAKFRKIIEKLLRWYSWITNFRLNVFHLKKSHKLKWLWWKSK